MGNQTTDYQKDETKAEIQEKFGDFIPFIFDVENPEQCPDEGAAQCKENAGRIGKFNGLNVALGGDYQDANETYKDCNNALKTNLLFKQDDRKKRKDYRPGLI